LNLQHLWLAGWLAGWLDCVKKNDWTESTKKSEVETREAKSKKS